MASLRLQKYLSACGICSRRHAEEAIKNGEVLVNGVAATIGQSIDPEKDSIKFAGKMVTRSEGLVYYAMNKPRGIETTCAQREGKSIVDIIDTPTRIFPIWRLDKDSSGLILLTNDGRLTHRLLHPSFEHEKEYLVTTYGKIDDLALEQMRKGVRYTITEGPRNHDEWRQWRMTKWRNLYDNKNSNNTPLSRGVGQQNKNGGFSGMTNKTKFIQTSPCIIKRASSDTFTIVLTEGKNRQIRRMVEACGHEVKKLKRIRIEHIQLGEMPEGAYRDLKRWEREELLRRAAIPLVDFDPIVGVVVHGDGKGREIGFPTANIIIPQVFNRMNNEEWIMSNGGIVPVIPSKWGDSRTRDGIQEDRLPAGSNTSQNSNESNLSPGSSDLRSYLTPSEDDGNQLGTRNSALGTSTVLPDATFSCRVRIGEEVYLGAGTFSHEKRREKKWERKEEEFEITPPSLGGGGNIVKNGGVQSHESGTFEVHILDFDRDIYGVSIHVDIMDIIRTNMRFPSIVELRQQIEKDVNHVRAHWGAVLEESHREERREKR